MLDFYKINIIPGKKSHEVVPEFIVKKSKDLMIRGGAFYAVWDEDIGKWSTNEERVQQIIDHDILKTCDEMSTPTSPKLLSHFSSQKWIEWQKYCKALPDNYIELDTSITFENSNVSKKDYVSKNLNYSIHSGDTTSWDTLLETLYSEEERKKIEWTIGAIISGDSKKLQKFLVFYGGPGTGKSTIINIIQQMFEGYTAVFDSKMLSSNASFALEAFNSNPLIAIQHDGDLSKIEDNTKINSIVSHEMMLVNEKYKKTYSNKFNTFLIMGTNKPVKITDSKSGILRRLIDVTPTGNKIPSKKYMELINNVCYEYGAICDKCLRRYEEMGFHYYDKYVPFSMIENTNDLYNFIEDNFDEMRDEICLNVAWRMYKDWCEDSNVQYVLTKRIFKEELKSYYKYFTERTKDKRNLYSKIKMDKFKYRDDEEFEPIEKDEYSWLKLDKDVSEFDHIFKDCPAQYSDKMKIWDNCQTTLKDLNTSLEHYVRTPTNLIILDFDFKDKEGNKDKEANLKAASRYPPTYAEYSKSGGGIHLHYYYEGNIEELSRNISDEIEIKIMVGKSSLRRRLSKCNDLPIATISSGLPKREIKVIQDKVLKDEKHLRACIKKALRKEIHANTAPNVNYIYSVLEEAYNGGMHYDVRDMRNSIQNFAMSSNNQAGNCMKLVSKMRFNSDDISDGIENANTPIIIFDCEVFPNLFIVCYKKLGEEKIFKLINPSPDEILMLTTFRLVGFNNRGYDNHILYARIMGYNNKQLFNLSQRIISGDKNAKFGEAYNLSYTDIYDYMSAANKMSLKKWEIKLGIHHQELGFRWDEPVPEDKWEMVADYCCNDVFATEAVWYETQSDFTAREILSELSGLTKNDTTNQHTTKIIFGNDKNPQSKFRYPDLSEIFPGYEFNEFGIDKSRYSDNAKTSTCKSIYKGEDPSEGGFAVGFPGYYVNAAVLDVASMHPHSMIALCMFGEYYTMRFKDLVDARIAIKHEDFETAAMLLEGLLKPFIERIKNGELKSEDVANALKTAINSVYGLTSAKFDNKFRDPRNKDNVAAKYGALFMIDLKQAIQELGYTVIHIKTDSIKIANADNFIIDFAKEFASKYGFEFEHESTYEKMVIENDAVYVAKYANSEWCEKHYGYIPKNNKKHGGEWTATGTRFKVPYVFKKIFSKEKIDFSDLCETKSVTTALYLDFNENKDTDDYRFIGKVGSFVPVKNGQGGGILLRQSGDKYSSVQNTKRPKGEPYRWFESEVAKELNKEVDYDYWNNMADEAIDVISKYTDFYQFVA